MIFQKKESKQERKNRELREAYKNNTNGYRDKCIARRDNLSLKRFSKSIEKLKGKCYLCKERLATEGHHPNYNKTSLIVPLCNECHKNYHKIRRLEN